MTADHDGNTAYREIRIIDANGKVICSQSGPVESAWALPITVEVDDINRDEHFSRSIGQALADEALRTVERMDDND